MCGIAGIAARATGVRVDEALRAMTQSIAHRGPDDEGFYVDRTADGSYDIGLGHRRLSIIDVDSGHQPMANEDGLVTLVFNGEIYNFEPLREDLIRRGHVFKTRSDTETIVHAYEEFGPRCVEKFRGMFAFALWDRKHQRLVLARDRFGKKPLFLYEKAGQLIFASEVKGILAAAPEPVRVDLDGLCAYLCYRYVPGPQTLFSGIRKLPPGSYAVWEAGTLKEERYYWPPDQLPYHDLGGPADPVPEFLRRLEESVRIRMISDVPFGAFLSGGIDSSTVVGLMTKISRIPVKTFAVGFSEDAYSELQFARQVATHFGTDHHELVVGDAEMIEHLPKLVRFRDAPVSEPSDIPIYLLAKEAARTVKMVLTGEGSDEMLGGYPKHLFEALVPFYQTLPRAMRSGVIEPLVTALPYRFRRAKTAVTTMGLEDYEGRMARWFGAMSVEERGRLTRLGSPSRQLGGGALPDGTASALRRTLFFDQTSWLPDNLLERGDRMTMAASLEARMPFMDQELASFVSSLPDRFRVRGARTKWILREAVKSVLPPEIIRRKKVGFRVPVSDWFRGPMRDYLCGSLLSASSRTRAYYEPAVLSRIVNDHLVGRQNHEKLLWTLLNLEIWHQEYGMG
jgi:asparagine synthase (glutamine-hydrolysing)